MISEIHHAAINVSDMEKSLAVYRDLLGMTIATDTEISGPEWEKFCGMAGSRIRTVVLRQGENKRGMVELIEAFPRPAPARDVPRGRYLGLFMLSFEVDDVDRKHRELSEKGIRFVSSPQTFPVGAMGKVRAALFRGPDDVMIELAQHLG